MRDGILSLDTQGAVRPADRRRGVGTSLLRHAQAHQAGRTRDVEPELPRRFVAWVGDSQPGALALFQHEGYEAIRFGFEMIKRGLDEVADVPVPEGIELRRARADEVTEVLWAEHEAFRDHPGHREWTDADVDAVPGQPGFDPSIWVVAWDGDQIAGVVENWVHAEENARLGFSRAWMHRVSVRRPWRKRGLARALLAESFRVLRERGIQDACLGVDANNPSGALALYESVGFERPQERPDVRARRPSALTRTARPVPRAVREAFQRATGDLPMQRWNVRRSRRVTNLRIGTSRVPILQSGCSLERPAHRGTWRVRPPRAATPARTRGSGRAPKRRSIAQTERR